MLFFLKKLECTKKEMRVREKFAVELNAINLKKFLLLILAQNLEQAQLKFKLVQNFCKLFTPIVEKRLGVSASVGFRLMKEFKPRPFHRTNLRAEKAGKKISIRCVSKNNQAKKEKSESEIASKTRFRSRRIVIKFRKDQKSANFKFNERRIRRFARQEEELHRF